MKIHLAATAVAVMTLAGCGSTANFTKGMEEPVKALNSAATLAQDAERDVLKSIATGISPRLWDEKEVAEKDELPFMVCRAAGSGPQDVRGDLQIFADGLETVKEVGAKPDDTSYAGYVHKLRQNAAAGKDTNDPDPKEVARKLKAKEDERLGRCLALFPVDVANTTRLVKPGGAGATPMLIARLLGADQLIKQILATGEALTREAAVRSTIAQLKKEFGDAAKRLKVTPPNNYGPYVNYAAGTAPLAESYNATVLGAAINIRRWYVAQQAAQQWQYLQTCRDAGRKGARACFGDPAVQAAANGFADAVYNYRRLAEVQPAKVHAAVDEAVKVASENQASKGIAQLIDGLIGIADSLKELDDAVDTYHDSRN